MTWQRADEHGAQELWSTEITPETLWSWAYGSVARLDVRALSIELHSGRRAVGRGEERSRAEAVVEGRSEYIWHTKA